MFAIFAELRYAVYEPKVIMLSGLLAVVICALPSDALGQNNILELEANIILRNHEPWMSGDELAAELNMKASFFSWGRTIETVLATSDWSAFAVASGSESHQ